MHIFVVFFVAEKLGSLEAQISRKKKAEIVISGGKKKKKKTIVNGSAGAHNTQAPDFRGLSPKNDVNIGLLRNLGR